MAQTQTRGLANNSVTGAKTGLGNADPIQARNAANTAWLNLLQADSSNHAVLLSPAYVGANKIVDSSQLGVANGVATLDSGGHIPLSQINVGAMEYQGTWNASTNTPALANGTGTSGYFYIASAAGTVNFGAGNITFAVGDLAFYNGTIWEKIAGSGTAPVTSVNTQTGAVVLTTDNISEGVTNLYFTNARVLAATLTGYTSGAGTISSADTVLSAIQKLNGNIAALPGQNSGQESLTLSSGDITSQYKDLAHTVVNGTLTVESFGVVQIQGTDYTLSVVAGKTRVTFAGDLASGGNAAYVSGDVLNAQYTY